MLGNWEKEETNAYLLSVYRARTPNTAKRSRIFYSKNFNERKNENEKRSEASKRIDVTKVGFLVSVLLNVMENSVFTFVAMCCFWKYMFCIFILIFMLMQCDLLNSINFINLPTKLIFGIY